MNGNGTRMQDEVLFQPNLPRRHRLGRWGLILFQMSTLVGIVVLTALVLNVLNRTFGYVAITYQVPPDALSINGIPVERLHPLDLAYLLRQHLAPEVLERLEREGPLEQRDRRELLDLLTTKVMRPKVLETWTLAQSVFCRQAIQSRVTRLYPEARLVFRSWLTPEFLTRPQSSRPEFAGVRTAVLGSLWVVAITIAFAFPIGVGTAIYLEEYAKGKDTWINRLIQTNINNLAGVPSIIYGILGLAIFVRALAPLTSGAVFGLVPEGTTANGRTILSAGLTLGLLILPIIIINAQEAIRAVPNSLRLASYGLGATQWQTIWHHVLPSAMPGILTGTILAMSRAIGETAPLIVVGASTFITVDPSGPFSKFTTLPIQIYQWTARPQDVFRHLAAAAIIVLLAMLLALNATAILLRNRYAKRRG